MTDRFRKTFRLSLDLYRYIWRQSRGRQIAISGLTFILTPLMMAPLELQRRIVNEALPSKNVGLLAMLGLIYLGVVILQGALKYGLNLLKGAVIEHIARDMRAAILTKTRRQAETRQTISAGTTVSILAAETEDVSGFGGDAIGLPLLTGGTILYVVGYLLWIEPAIAALALAIYLPQALIVPITQYSINRLARLRIVTVRSLGRVATAAGLGKPGRLTGMSRINRIYKLRMGIYARKYALTALGNFLDALGAIIVLTVGGYLVVRGQAQVGTLLVFISGLNKVADPWDQLINFYRSISNTAVAYDMIRSQIDEEPETEAAQPIR